MKRIRFGKFKHIEIALEIELRQTILKAYRKNKLIKFFNINEMREYQFHFQVFNVLGFAQK